MPMDLQATYDDAMLDFSRGDYDTAVAKLKSMLEVEPEHFDTQLALGMAYYRKGDYATAIAEGQKASRNAIGRSRPHHRRALDRSLADAAAGKSRDNQSPVLHGIAGAWYTHAGP